jgi:hypothetical protein
MIYSCDRVDGSHVVNVEIWTIDWAIECIHVLVLDKTSHIKAIEVLVHVRIYKIYLRLLLLAKMETLIVIS